MEIWVHQNNHSYRTCLKTPLWYEVMTWQSSEEVHEMIRLRKSSMELSWVRKASTSAPLQCAKHATFPNVMPSALIFAKGSQQSSIESSNHRQGPKCTQSHRASQRNRNKTLNPVTNSAEIEITFPFSSGINSEGVEDDGKSSQPTIRRLRLRLVVRDQLEKPFHGSIS